MVRHRNGSDIAILAGRIEICVNNQWSSICNDGRSDFDAAVACRQMGQPTITPQAIRQAANLFGQGDVPLLISDVACLGNEEAIVDCPSFQLPTQLSSHPSCRSTVYKLVLY